MKRSKQEILKEFENIPGVGKSIAEDFWDLGLRSKEDLKKENPEKLYEKLCEVRGKRIDRCMLYVMRCAHYYASKRKHEKRLLKWWNWKDIDREKYSFRGYDSAYEKLFLEEKRKLKKILGSTATVEHVGSTAVPGLGGKRIIDIAIGGSNCPDAKKKLTSFYEYRPKASTRERFFFKNHSGKAHIHLVLLNSVDWKEMIAFRDYLRKNPKARLEYERIKKQSVARARGKGKAYRRYKDAFIEKITAKALEK